MMSESEAAPSAQVVAHEFVKQYYTMLNAAPDFLHRFYSHNSSFIHGEDQFAVTGQAEIHKKIMSLSFDNCHARICQVDSQSSVSGSVVVQVIGELSNAGQPMRRFVQSFILAPQTSNKYYVHVDIFRYQDNYISVGDGEDIGEPYEGNQFIDNGEIGVTLLASDEQEANMVEDDTTETVMTTVPHEYINSNVVQSSSAAEPELVISSDVETVEPVAEDEMQASEEAAPELDNTEEIVSSSEPVVDEKPSETIAVEKVPETAPVMTPAPAPKPMTWAAMASRNAGGSSGSSQPAIVPSSTPSVRPPTGVQELKPEQTMQPPRAARQGPPVDERGNGSNGRVVVNGNKEAESGPKRTAGSTVGVYPDNQQVFVGNLPQQLADRELIDFFEQFGPVLDFRISRKIGGSQAGNNLGQKNFGFMVFEKPETVEKVLTARPLYLGKHRLNIEEKKPKEELARSRVARLSLSGSGRSSNDPPSANFVRPSANGPRRGGGREYRNDVRSNSSDDGRTN